MYARSCMFSSMPEQWQELMFSGLHTKTAEQRGHASTDVGSVLFLFNTLFY
jgi:hypothetical protein